MTVSANTRRLMMLGRARAKNRQQSLLSRSATNVGLSPNQIDYWGHIQGKVQPTFRHDYARSQSALS
ncbi:MAG: hypothetical protein AB4040_06500 [Synechococcus sp.]